MLAIVALVQLVVVLDGTIVTIALPQAQTDLGLSDGERSWVVTAYALAFGGLLLLGGRLVNYLGLKKAFMIGIVGFAIASGFGGVVQNGTELIIARGLQGVFAALLAPAALAILTITFTSGRERNIAFAVFGTVAGVGAAVGLLLGGLLTEYATWRWCLLINVPIAVVIVVAGSTSLRHSPPDRENPIDGWGALLVVLGLGAVVFGLTEAEKSWTSPQVIVSLVLGVLLVAAFVVTQARRAHPLLPLRVVTHRVRGTAFAIQAIAGAVMIGSMLYLTLHLQIVLGMKPFEAGLATLPQTVLIMVVAGVGSRYLEAIGPKPFLVLGPVLTAAGLFWLSFITAGGSYATHVLPGLALTGIGMGMVFLPLQNVALRGVSPQDAGVAGALSTASMQIGGSVGLAVWTTVAAGATGSAMTIDAMVDGYGAVFLGSALLMLVGGIIALVALPQHDRAAVAAEEKVMVPTGH
ncbi:DHA2 family efflux MFS transporter permease subunit [Sanguibacter inulinus]|uniref:DHA2 family efflux MFS transporter permease subunit n=1 Tax=Sanguibacter inulinus TaxID=60922 RepID=UPI0028044C90|nr:DHA2 family efflux MFS transporter permease subunit [Sanguibacter inulinus]